MRLGRTALVVFTALTVAPRAGFAQEPATEAIRISYRASGACPDAPAFTARVRIRSTHLRLAQPGENARTFDISLDDGSPASGTVGVVDGEQREGVRRVRAETCEQVADAIALVVALAINPGGPSRSSAESAAPDEGPRDVPSPTPPPRTEIAAQRRWSERPPAGSAIFAGADFGLAGGVTPQMLASVSPYVGWQSTAEGLVAPELRLALVRSVSAAPVLNGEASFVWTAGRLDGCPVALRAAALRFAPCTRIEAGAIQVETTGVEAPRSRLRGWFAAGLVGGVQWAVVDSLFAEAEFAALLRATDDRFVVLPNSVVDQVPLVGLSAALGLGARFP